MGFEPTPAKAMARAKAYSHLDKDLLNKIHIILNGGGGDGYHLRSMGIDCRKIVGCDYDPMTKIEAMKIGIVTSPYCDIVKTVEWAKRVWGKENIGSVNLDLPNTCQGGISHLDDILYLVDKTTLVFYTFLKSRDKGFKGLDSRISYLNTKISKYGRRVIDTIEYQSSRVGNNGSSMCVTVIK